MLILEVLLYFLLVCVGGEGVGGGLAGLVDGKLVELDLSKLSKMKIH